MKRMTFFAAMVASLMMLASCDKEDKNIALDSLPDQAKTFVENYFGELTISRVVKDYDDFSHDYKVYFSNGTKVEFSRSGEWEDIDCHGSKVPDGVLPEKILSYVQTNYPSNVVVQIERDGAYYDVELDSDLDLVFGRDGDFVRIDY